MLTAISFFSSHGTEVALGASIAVAQIYVGYKMVKPEFS